MGKLEIAAAYLTDSKAAAYDAFDSKSGVECRKVAAIISDRAAYFAAIEAKLLAENHPAAPNVTIIKNLFETRLEEVVNQIKAAETTGKTFDVLVAEKVAAEEAAKEVVVEEPIGIEVVVK